MFEILEGRLVYASKIGQDWGLINVAGTGYFEWDSVTKNVEFTKIPSISFTWDEKDNIGNPRHFPPVRRTTIGYAELVGMSDEEIESKITDIAAFLFVTRVLREER
jgi:hypothetical protein